MSAMLTTPPRASQLDTLRTALNSRGSQGGAVRGGTASESASNSRARRTDGSADRAVIICASGRGGSGTSLVSAMLALAAAGDGHRTLLIDGDELSGALSLLLGCTPALRWPALLAEGVHAQQLPIALSEHLSLVAGGQQESAPHVTLSPAERRQCFSRLHSLADHAELIVIDAGSRLDTVNAALDGCRGDARVLVVAGGNDPISMASSYALIKAVSNRRASPVVDIVANRLDHNRASRVADALAEGALQFLARPVGFAGALPHDFALDAALQAGMSFLDAATGSPVAVAAHDTVLRMLPLASTTRSGE